MLRQKLNGLPTTLNSTYDQILTRIEEADALNAMKLLLWLTFAERPIHVEDLAIILEYDVERQQFDVDAKLDFPDDVLKICSSLVTKMEDETVQFAHTSIKEYFQSKKRRIGSSVEVDPCFGHYFIGQCGLAYILQRKQVIPDDDSDENAPASMRFEKSLLQYAAHLWPQHILTCKQEPAVMNQIINLFQVESHDSLKYWVKAHNHQHWHHGIVPMKYPNYLQIAASHGLIETAKWLMVQWPVSSVECMKALSAAACNGHINILILLFEKGHIKVASHVYCEALIRASERGQKQVVRLLCEHAKDSDVFQKIINTAIPALYYGGYQQREAIKLLIDCSGLKLKIDRYILQHAAQYGNIEFVQLMLEKESEKQRRNKLVAIALDIAAEGGHKPIVELLLESGADMNAKPSAVLASQKGHLHIAELLLDTAIEENVYRRQISSALCTAAHAGHEELVRFLLERGADPNFLEKEHHDGQIPLHAASLRGHQSIAQLLIDNGADVNAQGGKYGYAIWAAMSQGHNEIIELLLQHGANISVHSGYDGEALVAACKGGYRNIVELLLDEGVDPNATRDQHDDDAFISALKRGHKDIVKLLLEKGAYVNGHRGKYAQAITPLYVASEYASEDVVRLLLEFGADVNIVGGYWGTALQVASYQGKKDSVQLLLEWGSNVNTLAGNRYGSALTCASCTGNKDIVQLLLEWGANVNIQTGNDFGPALIVASFYNHKEIVELLLEWGADVNCPGGKYGSALIAASFGNHKEIVELLLEWGADVNFPGEVNFYSHEKYGTALIQAASYAGNCYGSALTCASYKGNKDIVQLLLEWGANVNIQTGNDFGPALIEAPSYNRKEIVELLLEWGADVNCPGGQHGSALIAASFHNNKEIVEMLLQGGADVKFCHEQYGTALIQAASYGKVIVEMLLQHGADVNFCHEKCGTALIQAASYGKKVIVEMLLQHGADVNFCHEKYGTALYAASSTEIAQLLLAHGAEYLGPINDTSYLMENESDSTDNDSDSMT